MKLRSLFMGTPDFAVPCLKKLSEITEVVGVVTQPDKPRGRGQKLTPSPVKAYAVERGFTVYQPAKVKTDDFCEVLEEINPDIIIVVAFGQILSQRILDIPKYGCINVHASLLPRYRGAAPMQWSIINGEKKTGVTTMFMDAGLDTGDMLLKSEIAITENMTLEELHDSLMASGADVLEATINQIVSSTIKREKQDDSLSNYAPMLNKETGHIDWQKPAREIHNLVRGLNSWPGAYSFLAGQKFKIWRTEVLAEKTDAQAGTILAADKVLKVATGDGVLAVTELQAPSKKKMATGDYLRGHGQNLPAAFEN